MVGRLASLESSNALIGTFPLRVRVSLFQISYYSLAITLVSVSSSCFTLAVTMLEVYTDTPRAWEGSHFTIVHAKLSLVFRSGNNSY